MSNKIAVTANVVLLFSRDENTQVIIQIRRVHAVQVVVGGQRDQPELLVHRLPRVSVQRLNIVGGSRRHFGFGFVVHHNVILISKKKKCLKILGYRKKM